MLMSASAQMALILQRLPSPIEHVISSQALPHKLSLREAQPKL